GEGNHGEDVKEYYFYLDSTPTHSYLKYLYKYPQRAFPYGDLVRTNGARNKREPEYELLDTGVFDDDRYFDVFVEYAKASPEDVLIQITVHNRGPDAAELHLLPTLWFRNTWSDAPPVARPVLRKGPADGAVDATMQARRSEADDFYATVIPASLSPDAKNVMRQALAGMLWSKQFYNYDVDRWLSERGADPFQSSRRTVRNAHWHHMQNADIIS